MDDKQEESQSGWREDRRDGGWQRKTDTVRGRYRKRDKSELSMGMKKRGWD